MPKPHPLMHSSRASPAPFPRPPPPCPGTCARTCCAQTLVQAPRASPTLTSAQPPCKPLVQAWPSGTPPGAREQTPGVKAALVRGPRTSPTSARGPRARPSCKPPAQKQPPRAPLATSAALAPAPRRRQPRASATLVRARPSCEPSCAHLEAACEELVLHLEEVPLGGFALEGFVDDPEGAVVLDVRPARVAVAAR